MKVLRSIKMLVALVLTLTFLLTVPLQTVRAAENNGKYVSEVFVAYGKDADSAKKTLENRGFIPVEGNLNEGQNLRYDGIQNHRRYSRINHRPRGDEYAR